MASGRFEKCRHCKPPERNPWCHSTCKYYKDDRAALDEENKKKAADRDKEGFLFHIEKNRDKRIAKTKRR